MESVIAGLKMRESTVSYGDAYDVLEPHEPTIWLQPSFLDSEISRVAALSTLGKNMEGRKALVLGQCQPEKSGTTQSTKERLFIGETQREL